MRCRLPSTKWWRWGATRISGCLAASTQMTAKPSTLQCSEPASPKWRLAICTSCPLTGIDLPTAQAIDEVIHDERGRGCTVIMTTHDLSEAMVADFVVLLSGRVVAAGSPHAVLTRHNLTEAYGQGLMHVDEGAIFIDDPAHVPIPGRHAGMKRTIHTDANPSDVHHDDGAG